MRFYTLVFLFVFWGGLLTGITAQATDRVPARQCGIYSMYAVMQYYDNATPIDVLLKGGYTSHRIGSTLKDLQDIGKTAGLNTIPLKNLSIKDLVDSSYPIIISVRRNAGKKMFDHYYVILPATNSRSNILFDASTGKIFDGFDVLHGRWSGVGLIVTPSRIPVFNLFRLRYILIAFVILILFILRKIVLFFQKNKIVDKCGMSFSLVCFILIFSFSLSLVANLSVTGKSPLRNVNALSLVQYRHLDKFIPQLFASDIKSDLNNIFVLIDARKPHDYKRGHITNAINIDPWVKDETLNTLLRQYSKERYFVVYCQSSGCPYAMAVAQRLLEHGYENVYYYKGGWIDWVSQVEKL